MASPPSFFDAIREFHAARFLVIGCFLYFAIAYWARFSGTPKSIIKTLPSFVFLLAVISRYFYADISFIIILLLPFVYTSLLDELSNQYKQKYGYGIISLILYICTIVALIMTPLANPSKSGLIDGLVMIGAVILSIPSVLTAMICSALWSKVASKIEFKRALKNS